MAQPGAAVGDDDVVEPLQHRHHAAVVGLAERFGDRGIAFGSKNFQPARGLGGMGPHIRVPVERFIGEQVAHGGPRLLGNSLSKRTQVGVGVHRDHAIAAQRSEGGSQPDRCGGFSDAALEREDRNAVIAAHRLVHPIEELLVDQVIRGFAGVDGACRQLVYGASPSTGWGTPCFTEQRNLVEGGRPRYRRLGCKSRRAGIGMWPMMLGNPLRDRTGPDLRCRLG